MKNTNIQWSDDSVNPTSGCDGCELWTPGVGGPCYAGNFHETRLSKTLPLLYAPAFDEVRLIPGRMAKAARCMDLAGRNRATKPWLNGLRRKIFVGDMGDIFSADVTFEFLKTEVIDVANNPHGSRHDWLLLTKQPGQAVHFAAWLVSQGLAWPDNVWIGTSITGRASAGRIKHLIKIPAKHRYLSIEPLIEDPGLEVDQLMGVVDWLIIGGESDQGPHYGREFKLEWARALINVASKINVAAFVKQLGSNPTMRRRPLSLADRHGGDWNEWPADLRVRQLPTEIVTREIVT
jgi:protein gp37